MNTELAILPPPKPQPRCAVSVRAAVKDDLPFIDQLQKMHGHMVGWSPMKQLEKNVADGQIVIAEEVGTTALRAVSAHLGGPSSENRGTSPVGYCIAKDQYMKRDDVGIVYQLNVLPLKQRHLVGALLVKAVFDRAAYGCRLFSCWCAQDIQANWFWESIGFIPLAFRTGSRAKQRIHIFWQRRVRENDDSTPYWFPSQTTGGAVKEDRIVLPIPPGTHWRDAKPLILPGLPPPPPPPEEMPKTLPGGALVRPSAQKPRPPQVTKAHAAAIARSKSKHLGGVPAGKAAYITKGGVKYIDRADAPAEEFVEPTPAKPKKESKPRQKNDPTYVKAARELRDRYLEQVNAPGDRLLPSAYGKYDVSRQLEAAPSTVKSAPHPRLLDAA
jgi:hypothetical protein